MEYIVHLLEKVLLSNEKRFVKLNFHIVTQRISYKKALNEKNYKKKHSKDHDWDRYQRYFEKIEYFINNIMDNIITK